MTDYGIAAAEDREGATDAMYRARNIQYEHSDRVLGLESGGIGAMEPTSADRPFRVK